MGGKRMLREITFTGHVKRLPHSDTSFRSLFGARHIPALTLTPAWSLCFSRGQHMGELRVTVGRRAPKGRA